MTETRPRAHPRQADPDADLLDEGDPEPPIMPLSAEADHILQLRRRRAMAERDARLRRLRRAWGAER